MRIRLMQPGFETYTGQMGVIQFENGLSTADVSEFDAVRIAAVMLVKREDGGEVSINRDRSETVAEVVQPLKTSAELGHEAPGLGGDDSGERHYPDPDEGVEMGEGRPTRRYTESELAAIADADGIAGLRAIATPLGLKANSIRSLIQSILKVAGKEE